MSTGAAAGWTAGLVGAVAAFGLGGWFGYVLGRTAQHTDARRRDESSEPRKEQT